MPPIFIAALAFGGSGSLIAYLVLFGFKPTGDWARGPLVISCGAAAFAVSCLLWRLLCVPEHLISARRGALVGLLTGLFAHPLAWYLFLVWGYATGVRSSLGERAVNPLEALAGCFVFAFWSILLMGWLTVPAGGIAGWFLGRMLRPR